MFKKYTKQLFEKEVASAKDDFSDLDLVPPSLPTNFAEQIVDYTFSDTSSSSKKEFNGTLEEPETTIGEKVSLKGELSFQKILRIDGNFEGELVSEGKLVVGPTGCVKAHINLNEAVIAGKVEGNIRVKGHLDLRGQAEINGNITAATLSVEEGVCINGQVCVMGAGSSSFSEEIYQEEENTNP